MDGINNKKYINDSDVKFFFEVHCRKCDYKNKYLILKKDCPVCGNKVKYWKKFNDTLPTYKHNKSTWINGITEIYS